MTVGAPSTHNRGIVDGQDLPEIEVRREKTAKRSRGREMRLFFGVNCCQDSAKGASCVVFKELELEALDLRVALHDFGLVAAAIRSVRSHNLFRRSGRLVFHEEQISPQQVYAPIYRCMGVFAGMTETEKKL